MICGNIFYRNKFPSKKILMKQLNMWPQIYYQFFYNIEDIVEFFKKNSYLLVLKEKNFSDKNLNFSNIKSHFDEIDRYNLIFEKKMIDLTIGITTFNRTKFLKECLRSVLRQSNGNIKIIISNDNPDRKLTLKNLNLLHQKNIVIFNQKKI